MGENWAPIVSPFSLKSPPGVKIAPAASLTPGTLRTFGSIRAEKALTSPLSWRTGCLAVITTDVPFSDSWKISSKAALIVSVRT